MALHYLDKPWGRKRESSAISIVTAKGRELEGVREVAW